MVGMRVLGASSIAGAMKACAEGTGRKVLVDALRRAGEPMRARMGQLAARSPEAPHLADNMAISEVRTIDGVALDEFEAAVAIGPSKGFYYGSFIEFGWVHHPQARPFARPAYDEGIDAAMGVLGVEIWNALARAASKATA